MTSMIKEIVRVKAEGLLLIVANPVDVLTHVALKVSGFKKERVIGSGTVLDTARLKYLLSEKLKVDTRNIHAVNMGDSEFVAWSFSNVSGMPMEKFFHLRGFDDMDSLKEEIHIEVRDSAYHIIERKGATYYGIALSVVRICECIVKNQHSILPISTELEGEYNAFGLALSVPAILGSEGVEAVLELPLSNNELKELEESRNTLCNIIKDLEL
jgi:L-lactate dehydrogenase